MDKTALVAPDLDRISRGEELIEELKKAEYPVHRAFWWYSSERYSDWRLVIASPLVDQRGPLAAYKKLDAVLRKHRPDLILWVKSVHLVSPNDSLIRDLDKTYPEGDMTSRAINLCGSTVGSTYIEQAYLYSPHAVTE
jgi:hypothetical protein